MGLYIDEEMKLLINGELSVTLKRIIDKTDQYQYVKAFVLYIPIPKPPKIEGGEPYIYRKLRSEFPTVARDRYYKYVIHTPNGDGGKFITISFYKDKTIIPMRYTLEDFLRDWRPMLENVGINITGN